jgi:hypothetical protein
MTKAAAGMPLSSPDPYRLVNFLGFASLAVYFLANDLLGGVGEISHQGGIQLLKAIARRSANGHERCDMSLTTTGPRRD